VWRLCLLPVVVVGLAFRGPGAVVQSAETARVQNLEGRYERTGVVDRAVEVQFRGLGLVLVPPVFIDELLTCPRRGTSGDSEFIFRKQGPAMYMALLPKSGVACALTELGSLVELTDGALLLRRSVTLTGEGSSPIHGDQEDRFSKERRDGLEWLVVETRIEWTKRSLFRSKKMEYRSLVRFRKLAELP
jgi:hypothetical protein